MSVSFVFPGQGSQSVGMGREFIETFPIARHVMQEVEDSLSQKLTQLILEGPIDTLTLTENAQPALLAVSMAVLKTIEKESGKSVAELASHLAGHSLGEYSALCAAGVFSVSQAVKLVRLRGLEMQKATPLGQGAMAAILGLELETVESLLNDLQEPSHLCVIANDNSPGQVVISGHFDAVNQAMEKATKAGAKRAILLPVSAPFHSPLMEPAALVMRQALEETDLKPPSLPVIVNVTAMPVVGKTVLPGLLAQQITGRVRWRESVQTLSQLGCQHVIEIGAGKVLTGLNKRIDPSLQTSSINTPKDLEEFLQDIQL
ncbi:ACP S-malonyltransferase [Candidatus Finniella inopinata]|uniref:Malonyl CoA-acyl carrier protein transacylase n=1 Tax=Candidatus Finniella inopinata TaxID=1696036 RepID=A0A4Q7DKI8_9PROT|nr:ACP S-malonyltransferase [Candidatus Finniella inopinata]RZI46898.1 [acyl-carrier-protein] S-malonyltransferase [Candidatus Finniella inopinata]